MIQKSVAKVRLVLIIRSFWPCLHRRRFFTGKVVQEQVGPQASSMQQSYEELNQSVTSSSSLCKTRERRSLKYYLTYCLWLPKNCA